MSNFNKFFKTISITVFSAGFFEYESATLSNILGVGLGTERIDHCTLNLSNDLTNIFKINTVSKVKGRTPSKSESWKGSSENNICLVAATSENNINKSNNEIIKNDNEIIQYIRFNNKTKYQHAIKYNHKNN